jgi:arsenical pump membrane protein
VSSGIAEVIAAITLIAVLAFAVTRPRDLPEAVAAVPGALALCALGVISWTQAWAQIVELAPTILFLAGVLMLAQLAQAEGVFVAAGQWMARRAEGRPVRLLGLVFVVASLTTAVLSLDATVVLLTPVVFATASRVGARPKPQVYATSHLANSASLLLPVSNLTNLLAISVAGLSFVHFAGLMLAPWLVVIAVEYVVFRWYFRTDLSVVATPPSPVTPKQDPRFAFAVLAATLVGFAASSWLGYEPFWAALAGVVVLTGKRIAAAPHSTRGELAALGRASNVWFLLFVIGLSIVVQAVVDHGLADFMRTLLPGQADLVGLLWLAVVAALLANLVNNLPAVLVLLPLVAPLGPVAVLAVLIGVNVGPNLTYVGSLATLLWRRIMAAHDHDAEIMEFTKLGALTVPLSLIGATVALWLSAVAMGV